MNPLPLFPRISRATTSRARNLIYRLLGVRFKGYVWLRNISIPRNWSDITIEAGAALDEHVVLLCSGEARRDKIQIGPAVYINRFTMIDAHRSIRIGAQTMIGPYSYITDGNHSRATDGNLAAGAMKISPVEVGQNVWIGAHVSILSGVIIGDHATIGAGAVVTSNVAPGSTVVGVPARPIGKHP